MVRLAQALKQTLPILQAHCCVPVCLKGIMRDTGLDGEAKQHW